MESIIDSGKNDFSAKDEQPVSLLKTLRKLNYFGNNRLIECSAAKAPETIHTPGAIVSTINTQAPADIPIGTRADIDLDDAEALASIRFDQQQFLVCHLRKMVELAQAKQKIIQLHYFDVDFYINPRLQRVHTLVKEKNLRTFGSLPLERGRLYHNKVNRIPVEVEFHGYSYSLDAILWHMALSASRGRLPMSADLDETYQLVHMPDLAHLPSFEHASQIAAQWKQAPRTIREMLDKLDLPQRYVFAFVSATLLTGYLQAFSVTQQMPRNKTCHTNQGWLKRFISLQS